MLLTTAQILQFVELLMAINLTLTSVRTISFAFLFFFNHGILPNFWPNNEKERCGAKVIGLKLFLKNETYLSIFCSSSLSRRLSVILGMNLSGDLLDMN